MAVPVENSDISNASVVSQLSRYANSQIIYWGPMRKVTFETYRRKEEVTTDQDRFMVIPKGMEYRPDLVSREAYGVVDFWYRIMEVNRIFDIYDFKAGRNIKIPGNVFS